MIGQLFRRRRRSRVSQLLEAPRRDLERMRGSVPAPGDLLADLAARTGVDLADIAERLLARISEASARASTEAELLAESQRARQLRDLAVRAAEQAELAYAASAASATRLVDSVPRRRQRSHRGLILLSVISGLTVGGAIAYFFLSRPAERRPEEDAGDAGEPISGESVSGYPATLQSPGFFAELGERITRARRAAKATQSSTERRLWRQYRAGEEAGNL
jgi:hypothetical protein